MKVSWETYPSLELLNSDLVSLQDVIARHGLIVIEPPCAKLSSLFIMRQAWVTSSSSIQVRRNSSSLDKL